MLREMLKVSHFKVDTKKGKIMHSDGQDPEFFMPLDFRNNYIQHLRGTVENNMKAVPGYLSDDFEFLLLNKDVIHPSDIVA